MKDNWNYLVKINSLPKLEGQALVDALKAYKEETDEKKKQKIKDKITEGQLHYVAAHILKRYKGDRFEPHYDDMINEAVAGLIYTIEKFDPTKGAQFITYLTINIQRKLSDYVNSIYNGHIHIPPNIRALMYKYAQLRERYFKQWDTYPSDEYLIQKLDVTQQVYNNLKMAIDGGQEPEDLDNIDRDNLPTNHTSINTELMETYVEKLLPIEQYIIRQKYCIGTTTKTPVKITELSKTLQISIKKIKEIEAIAIKKLIKIHKNENPNNHTL